MTTAFFDRVKFYTATIGQGPVLAGAALSRYRGPVQAAIPDGAQCALLIEMSGGAWEVSTGVWNQAAGTFSRVLRESYPVPGALLNLDGTGVVTVTVGAQEMVEASAFVFRNRIINGAMRIDQRHAGAFVVLPLNGNLITLDRWRVGAPASGGQLNVQQYALVGYAPISYSQFGINLYASAVLAAPAAGDIANIGQSIEGLNIADLKWGTPQAQPVTISLVCAAGLAGDYGISLSSGSANQSYVHKVTLAQFAITRVTFTVPGPTTGAWPTDNSGAVYLAFALASGTTYKTATLDAWQPGLFLAPSTQANMFSAINQNMVLTDVQLEAGQAASAFERRPFAVELQLCQRYYETSFDYGVAPADKLLAFVVNSVAYSVSTAFATCVFQVQKRTIPGTITFYSSASSPGSTPGRWAYLVTTWIESTAATSAASATPKGFNVSLNNLASTFTGQFAYSLSGNWAADAEI